MAAGVPTIDLEQGLSRIPCPKCGVGQVRPTDIHDGAHLSFGCPIPRCDFHARALLPTLGKKLLYLDTSVWIQIARAYVSKADPAWVELHKCLRGAAGDNVLCCVSSRIIREEVELGHDAEEISRLPLSVGASRCRIALEVKESQLLRALDRYLDGLPPHAETKPPLEDVFEAKAWPHRWLATRHLDMYLETGRQWIDERRTSRTAHRNLVQSIFEKHASAGARYDAIRNLELRGYGKGLADEFRVKRADLASLDAGRMMRAATTVTTAEQLAKHVRSRTGCEESEALERVLAFFESEHAASTPRGVISAALWAGIAMKVRGSPGRPVDEGDDADIDQIATILPYADRLYCDRFFHDLCTRDPQRAHVSPYGEVSRLGPRQIPGLIAEVESWRAEAAEMVALSDRIEETIRAGGAQKEVMAAMRRYLEARGIDVDAEVARRRIAQLAERGKKAGKERGSES